MRIMGLRGVSRGKKVKTTIPVKDNRPENLMNRESTIARTNKIEVADFTCVSTWRGFVSVAFIIDIFSRMFFGWKDSQSMRTDFTLDALKQATKARQVTDKLIHHSDRGSQYAALSYSDRLIDEGIEPSVGSKGGFL